MAAYVKPKTVGLMPAMLSIAAAFILTAIVVAVSLRLILPESGVVEISQPHPALDDVETFPDQGRDHVLTRVFYDSRFPTSGPHAPTPAAPGFYDAEVLPELLVHSLEHGNIVIYYDTPGDAALSTLRSWARQYRGSWDGVLVVPRPGLGSGIVLTAWTKKLESENFDEAAAFAFIDAFRGRGPENAVR